MLSFRFVNMKLIHSMITCLHKKVKLVLLSFNRVFVFLCHNLHLIVQYLQLIYKHKLNGKCFVFY